MKNHNCSLSHCQRCGECIPITSVLCNVCQHIEHNETTDILSKLLWLNHGCPSHTLYGDDGEMQCNNVTKHLPIDFKRDSAETINKKIINGNLEQFKKMEKCQHKFTYTNERVYCIDCGKEQL